MPVRNADDTREASYAGFFDFKADDAAGVGRSYGCPFGEQARQGDIPVSSKYYRTLIVQGSATRIGGGGHNIFHSTASVAFDISTRTVSVELDVKILDYFRNPVSIGTYRGQFAVDPATGRFAGKPTATGVLSTDSEISGAMFGPGGAEMIVTYALNTRQTEDTDRRIEGRSFHIAE